MSNCDNGTEAESDAIRTLIKQCNSIRRRGRHGNQKHCAGPFDCVAVAVERVSVADRLRQHTRQQTSRQCAFVGCVARYDGGQRRIGGKVVVVFTHRCGRHTTDDNLLR
jgi:hypothetical protein